MKKNYHTHTVRCHHADGTEREYIEKAVEAGLETLGFSDHTPYIFKDGYVSPSKMLPEELPGYVDTLQKLRKEYEDRLYIPIGLETEYYRDNWDDYLRMIDHSGVEYMILGQHFSKLETWGAKYSGRADDDRQRVNDYIDSVVDGARTGLFSYIAHPDMINYKGEDEEWFISRLDYMVKQVMNEGLPFEINMLGLRENRHYPSRRFLKILAENHATVILGSDAHEPQWVYHQPTIDRALELVAEYRLTLTEDPDIGRLRRKGLL